MEECQCALCKAHDLYRWATIMECKCFCHQVDYPVAHDNLCCQFPNGVKADNPHKNLESAEHYKKALEKLAENW